jgi:hypothetical protein
MVMHKKLLADSESRRSFIGGSDARIIMDQDEKALTCLWQEYPERHQERAVPGEAPPYFPGFFLIGSRSLTPGPPPFSSMNSTPAFSRTLLMFESVSGSPAYRPTSRLVTVLRCKPVASARSRTVQFKAARAIRTCALVTVISLCYCHMWQQHTLIMKE